MTWLGPKTIKDLFALETVEKSLAMSFLLTWELPMATLQGNPDLLIAVTFDPLGLLGLLPAVKTTLWLFMKDRLSNSRVPKRIMLVIVNLFAIHPMATFGPLQASMARFFFMKAKTPN